ncbi:MAG: ATP-dependent DNA helicase RecG [Planctomycetes bacterium]|jgi:ATP-dependent DNA helicase RecG|nr:ATP-dependent DNA helicase RecG [Planctomycetota bacterium]
MAELSLDTPAQYGQGVGPRRAEQLAELGIHTIEDLLTYYPRRFDLRRQAQPIATLTGNESEPVTVAGEVISARMNRYGSRPVFRAVLDDGSAEIEVKWFHGGYLQRQIRPGIHIAVNGKLSEYRRQLQFVNPKHQVLWDAEGADLDRDELLPVYPAGAHLSSNIIASIIRKNLPAASRLLRPWFDRTYLSQRGLVDRPTAIQAMHRPEDREQWGQARRRLAYDECLLLQLGIAIMRQRETSRPAHPLPPSARIDQRIRARFPFALTTAQDRAVAEIVADLASPRPMNRLLQGDVGSGKTVVALYAALQAVAHRRQAAILAPTELLARQHYAKVCQYLEGSRVNIRLLVGGMQARQRDRTLAELASGEVDIAVGTHALLGESVDFAHLALVVVDEQHKFGVRQRTAMRGKGFAPHYLVMTATPIPRTLALTVFGDLDVSTIDEPPPGRGETRTVLRTEKELDTILDITAAQLRKGRQAYFIYPLVSPSPDLELTAANDAYEQLSAGPLGEFGVGLVHGQMPNDDKQRVMKRFRDGQVKVLVASVVVEVGVDVPSANVMVIMHAERFGLAQLHQLRGRVGRGSDDALCMLVATPNNPIASERLRVLTETSDGFRIAEEDLRIRGPGEIFGTRQHGLPELKVADLVEDFELLRLARRDAFAIIDEDPDLAAPHNQQLRRQVQKLYADRLDLLGGA